jgi:hypothetical protein
MNKLSQLRSKLNSTQRQIQELLAEFQGRSPLLPASLYQLKRRCGKQNCRCNQGQLHATTVLSYRGKQNKQTITPPTDQIPKLKTVTDEYRRVRQARARLVKLQQQLIDMVDQMQELRVQQGERELDKIRSASARSTRR